MNEHGTSDHAETVFEGTFVVTARRFDAIDLRVTQTEDGQLTDAVYTGPIPLEELTPKEQQQLHGGCFGLFRRQMVTYSDGGQEMVETITPDPNQAPHQRSPERTKRLLSLALQSNLEN